MASGWEKRNARARALGYRNYYDYRVHGYGARAPETPPPRGEALAAARGHRGASDLLSVSDRIEIMSIVGTKRDAQGRWVSALALVELDDGTTREFRLTKKQLQTDFLNDFIDKIEASGATVIEFETP